MISPFGLDVWCLVVQYGGPELFGRAMRLCGPLRRRLLDLAARLDPAPGAVDWFEAECLLRTGAREPPPHVLGLRHCALACLRRGMLAREVASDDEPRSVRALVWRRRTSLRHDRALAALAPVVVPSTLVPPSLWVLNPYDPAHRAVISALCALRRVWRPRELVDGLGLDGLHALVRCVVSRVLDRRLTAWGNCPAALGLGQSRGEVARWAELVDVSLRDDPLALAALCLRSAEASRGGCACEWQSCARAVVWLLRANRCAAAGVIALLSSDLVGHLYEDDAELEALLCAASAREFRALLMHNAAVGHLRCGGRCALLLRVYAERRDVEMLDSDLFTSLHCCHCAPDAFEELEEYRALPPRGRGFLLAQIAASPTRRYIRTLERNKNAATYLRAYLASLPDGDDKRALVCVCVSLIHHPWPLFSVRWREQRRTQTLEADDGPLV